MRDLCIAVLLQGRVNGYTMISCCTDGIQSIIRIERIPGPVMAYPGYINSR